MKRWKPVVGLLLLVGVVSAYNTQPKTMAQFGQEAQVAEEKVTYPDPSKLTEKQLNHAKAKLMEAEVAQATEQYQNAKVSSMKLIMSCEDKGEGCAEVKSSIQEAQVAEAKVVKLKNIYNKLADRDQKCPTDGTPCDNQ